MRPYLWQIQEGDTLPLVATALHDGHEVRQEVSNAFALDEAGRLREEDPYTGTWSQITDTWIVVNRSRFELDLNRPREQAVYRTPADAWGLQVWQEDLPDDLVARSLQNYDAFYEQVEHLFQRLTRRFGRFVVFDLHSYNHRRDGPEAPPADPAANPEINIGTGTLVDRSAWATVIDRFLDDLRQVKMDDGRYLDVRENVRFRGGHFARWTHKTFPQSACVLSIEVKKFFMDEWSGAPDYDCVVDIFRALQATIPGVLETLQHLGKELRP